MQKKYAAPLMLLLSIWIIVTTLTACKKTQAEQKLQELSENAITFTDSLDREVSIDNSQKVAILMGTKIQHISNI